MGILTRILASPVVGPIQGLLWLARTVEQQIQAEGDSEDKVRAELMELELRLDLGEIGTDEYEAREAELLRRLRDIKEDEDG